MKENLTVKELMTLKAELEMDIIKHIANVATEFIEKTGVPIADISIDVPSITSLGERVSELFVDASVVLDLSILDALLMGREKLDNHKEDTPGQQYIFGSEL